MKVEVDRLLNLAIESRRVKPGSGAWSALARLLNVSEQTITNWKTRGISLAKKVEICDRFGWNRAWIETGKGPMWAPTKTEMLRQASSSYEDAIILTALERSLIVEFRALLPEQQDLIVSSVHAQFEENKRIYQEMRQKFGDPVADERVGTHYGTPNKEKK